MFLSCSVAQGIPLHAWVRDIQVGLSAAGLAQFLLLWERIASLPPLYASGPLLVFSTHVLLTRLCFSVLLPTNPLRSFGGLELRWNTKSLLGWLSTIAAGPESAACDEVTCPLGDHELETTDHLLLQCPFSRSLWFEVLSITLSSAGLSG